ncbi:hypothetical protein QJS10_CPA09g01289 [Acorus calamus]|uniref:Uncharacterized protein n=1 Tax=Acorus calamus TaxID=4465 RepID=A0AAV9E9E4_ACOCL|nr:hypothetical protein QJS10_CPA09g01289 [Acorus calamus]
MGRQTGFGMSVYEGIQREMRRDSSLTCLVISIRFLYQSGFRIQSFGDHSPGIPSMFEDVMIGGDGYLETEDSPQGSNVHVAFVSGETPH